MKLPLLTRPRLDGPIYEVRPTEHGAVLIPYYAEPDAARDLSQDEAVQWIKTCRQCPEGIVFGVRGRS